MKRNGITVAIAFVLALLLFGTVPVLAVVLNRREIPMTEAVGEQGKTRWYLVLVHNRENRLTGAVAVRTDTAAMRVEITGYPKETEVAFDTAVGTLAECYAVNGAVAAESLSAVTRVDYEAVLLLSAASLGRLAARVGGVPLTLPKAAGNLLAGEQTVTSLQIEELLNYTVWDEATTGQATLHAELTAALLKRYLLPQRDLRAAFNSLASECETRLTIAQYTVWESEWCTLAAAECDYGTCVPDGQCIGVGEYTRYVLTE